MTSEQIIALVIVLTVTFTLIGLLIFVAVRNNVYRKFVIENSQAIKNIKNINDRYTFKTYNSVVEFHHRFDNKSYWRKTEPIAFLSREIRSNLKHWFGIRDMIVFNTTRGKEYSGEVKKAFVPINKDICDNNQKSFNKCCKSEKKVFDSLIKHPQTTIRINVTLQYVSRKRKVNQLYKRIFVRCW